ncbi:hypothetical protein PQR53_28645 [Paraburkholderia fungorum]|uniref:hypothetical protein n=1 Tax=Paraburkholderia fungorum TaxID=134537 RepID=UPI0038BAB792
MESAVDIKSGNTESAAVAGELKGWSFAYPTAVFGAFTAAIVIGCAYDLWRHLLPETWRGTSTGILGGTIGAMVFVASRIIDHDKLLLSGLGRGPATKEHVGYLRGRLLFGVPSGFVLSAIVASFFPHVSDACLTAIGIVGGFSCTLLPTMAAAADAATMKYLAGNKRAARNPSQSNGSPRKRVAGGSRNPRVVVSSARMADRSDKALGK